MAAEQKSDSPNELPSKAVEALQRMTLDDSQDPTKAWDRLKNNQPFINSNRLVKLVADPSQPKPAGHLRFVCVSDSHSHCPPNFIPEGDVLLHAGDFTKRGTQPEIEQFVESYLVKLPHRYKVIIAGNHDLSLDEASYKASNYERFHRNLERVNTKEMEALLRRHSHYLLDESVTIEGIKIFGSPWQPWFYDWGFNLERGQPCLDRWKEIPNDTDILITHGPPLGRGDLCSSAQRAGCLDLLKEIQMRIKPKVHLFGHIHEAYGVSSDGVTTYINASICTLQYRPVQKPIVFDYPLPAVSSL